MMYIGKAKLDHRGRITLPKSFIKANDIEPQSDVYFTSIQTSDNAIRLYFKCLTHEIKEEVNSNELDRN